MLGEGDSSTCLGEAKDCAKASPRVASSELRSELLKGGLCIGDYIGDDYRGY